MFGSRFLRLRGKYPYSFQAFQSGVEQFHMDFAREHKKSTVIRYSAFIMQIMIDLQFYGSLTDNAPMASIGRVEHFIIPFCGTRLVAVACGPAAA